jgi:hypothetical protein
MKQNTQYTLTHKQYIEQHNETEYTVHIYTQTIHRTTQWNRIHSTHLHTNNTQNNTMKQNTQYTLTHKQYTVHTYKQTIHSTHLHTNNTQYTCTHKVEYVFNWIKNQVSRTNHHFMLMDSLIDVSINIWLNNACSASTTGKLWMIMII